MCAQAIYKRDTTILEHGKYSAHVLQLIPIQVGVNQFVAFAGLRKEFARPDQLPYYGRYHARYAHCTP
mgnify:CR=1 FL=1